MQVRVRSDGSAGLDIWIPKGKKRLTYTAQGMVPVNSIFADIKGNKRFQLHTADDESASLAIWNSSGQSPITAKTNADGRYGCTLDFNDQPVRMKFKLRVVKANESHQPK